MYYSLEVMSLIGFNWVRVAKGGFLSIEPTLTAFT